MVGIGLGAAQIAHSEVSKAAPDACRLLGNSSGLSYVLAIRKTQSDDPVRDFTPISFLVKSTFGVFVHPSVPAKSLGELVAYARANPGRLNYETPSAAAVLLTAVLLKETNTETRLGDLLEPIDPHRPRGFFDGA